MDQAVTLRTVKAKTFKEVSEQFGASISTIIRRFDQLAVKEIADVRDWPQVIAIDEYKRDTREGKYQLIIANGETKEPIDILPNRKKKTIKNDRQTNGGQVKVVVMDMGPSFKAAVRKALGKPVIVADRFHFCRYIYWVLKMRDVFYKDSKKLTKEDRWYFG